MTYYDNNAVAQAIQALRETFDYMNTRYGTNQRHWWAIARRARLIDTGQYIKTSEQPRLTISWKIVGEEGPEFGPLHDERVLHHPTISLACFNRHYLCSGATYTDHGWVTCQCDCHKENS